MAAADQLIALVTKTADKLNALNTAIGTKANIGVSSDAGNNLSVGSDSKPFFNASNIPLGVSSDAGNALILGTDDKPYLENDLFVPSTRILSAGTGINVIGDLSQNRSITLDFDYLDGRYGEGFKQREAVVAATSSNITLSGLQTIDGVLLVAGDRVLVRQQTNAAQNGVYIASSTAWTRATDFDEPDIEEVTQGASVYVEDGTLLKGTGWTLQTPPPYVIGTTELNFIQYAGASSYTGGNLITIAGNLINHDTGSWVAKSNLSGAQVISNLSVDAYGHPTNWTTRNLTAGNIGAEPSFSKNTAFNKNFGTTSGTVAQGNDSRINNGQTAFGWGNHASAGYITGSYTGFDSRYVNVTGDVMSGQLSISNSNLDAISVDQSNTNTGAYIRNSGTGRAMILRSNGGDLIQFRNDLNQEVATVESGGTIRTNSDLHVGGSATIGSGITGSPIRAIGFGVGDSNVNYIRLYESNGSIAQGDIGFTSGGDSTFRIINNVSGTSLNVSDSGGENGLQYFTGSSTRTVYHNGNLTSFTDGRYYTKAQSDSNYVLKNARTDGGYAWIRYNGTGSPFYATNQGTGDLIRLLQGSGDGAVKFYVTNNGTTVATAFQGIGSGLTNVNAARVDGKHIWTGSQASYDAIGTKDSNTIYFIT